MDSGDTGSLQSSSGGEEECDSRADSISAFINQQTTNLGPISSPPPQQPPFTTTMFDPLSNYFTDQTVLSRPNHQNPLLSLDSSMLWSKTLDQNHNHNHNQNIQINPFTEFQALNFTPTSNPTANNPLIPRRSPTTVLTTDTTAAADQIPITTTTATIPPVRNPKKRSRASRRAPTTVLTTDTTNFRAMVQEFTGIPAPPFTSSSSPFIRTRLDLFGTPSSIRSNPSHPPPPYLLRPFPQKLQPPPSSNSNNNMQNLINNLTFQSNNQSLGVGPISSFLASKTQDGNIGMKMGRLDEFGLMMNNIVSSSSVGSDNVNPAPANWVTTTTTTSLSNNF